MRNSNGINSNISINDINMRKTNIAKTLAQDALLDKPLKSNGLSTMTENLIDGLDSGLAPVTIIEQMVVDDSHFSKLMAAVSIKLRAGQKLSDALKCFPNATPEYYRALIEAAEISSNWTAKDRENPNSKPGILDLLLIYLKRDAKIRTKIAGAMIYPSLIMGFLVLAVLIITFYVLPRLKEFFIVLDLTKNMNFATATLLAVGEFTENYYWAVPVGILLAIALAIVFWRSGGKELWHKYQFDMYVIGKTIKKIALAEIFSLFSTLHSAGIAPQQSLQIIAKSCRNSVLAKAIATATDKLYQGKTLSESLKTSHPIFENETFQVIHSAEVTGNLDVRPLRFSQNLFMKAEIEIDNLIATIPAIMLGLVGVGVGFIVIGFYGAFFSSLGGLK